MKKVHDWFLPEYDSHYEQWMITNNEKNYQRLQREYALKQVKHFRTAVDIGGNIGSLSPAGIALGNIKDAIAIIASNRATVGANQARLYSVSEQISVTSENLVATSSRIQDVDVADEAVDFAKFNILMQSGTSMLAQANQLSRNALSLLQ